MNRLIFRLIFSVSLVIISNFGYADDGEFVSQFTKISSINAQITDKQCQEIFSEPLYYTIVNDKPVYKKGKNHIISDYKRIQSTFIDTEHQLFLGREEAQFTFNQQAKQENLIVYFMLDRKNNTILGGWYVPNYCKGIVEGHALKN